MVDESHPDDAPLHPAFEWDDPTAANEYRMYQARHIIRSVRVIVENNDQPRYIHVPTIVSEEKPSYYREASEVAKRLDEWTRALSQANAQLSAAKRSLEDLEKLASTGAAPADRVENIAAAMRALEVAAIALKAA